MTNPGQIRVGSGVSRQFEAPQAAAALNALDDGRMPDEKVLIAAIRQVRKVRGWVVRNGAPGKNAEIIRTLDDWLDVLRWALREPRGSAGTVCETCGRRPARIGRQCNRCAESSGTRPHGKIGEAL